MVPLDPSTREKRRKELYVEWCDKHETFKEFISSAKNRMRKMCNRFSSRSVTTENHTVFFDFFMLTPVVIGDNLYVDPNHWATAFMKWNIGDRATVLFRAILTQQDIIDRDSDSLLSMNVGIQEKIVAVKRAAKWMTNKSRDPWSWPFTWQETEQLSTEENEIVDQAFATVKSKNIYPLFSLEDLPVEFMDGFISKENDEAGLEELDDQTLQLLHDIVQSRDDDPTFFQKIVSLGILGNAAQTTRELTKICIPLNTEVFVDATQFSVDRCLEATKKDGKVDMAEILFRKCWGTECITTSFKSLEDICPVTHLAILRGVEWISIHKDTISILEFDSAIPGHNVYPSAEEVEDIENMFRTYVGVIRSPNGERIKDPNFVKYIDVEMEGVEEPDGNDSEIPSQNPGKLLDGWVTANFPTEHLQQVGCTEGVRPCSSIGLKNVVSFDNYCLILEPEATVQTGFSDRQFQYHSATAGSPELPTKCISNLPNDEIRNESDDSGQAMQIETGSVDCQSPPTPVTPQVQRIRMIATSNYCNCEHVPEIICLRVNSHSQEGNVTIGENGFDMQRVIWDEGFRNLKDKGETQAKVGLFLFGKLFTPNELLKKPEKGKKKKSVLSLTKTQGILDSLSIMKAMIRNGIQLSGLEAGGKMGIKVHKRSVEEIGFLEIKIFVEGRNYFAKKN